MERETGLEPVGGLRLMERETGLEPVGGLGLVERETGLEPATACLEGIRIILPRYRYISQSKPEAGLFSGRVSLQATHYLYFLINSEKLQGL
jgi:hypothetical protein